MERYAILISCEEYKSLTPTCYCHNDLFSLREILINYCDYQACNITDIMAYEGCEEDGASYIYSKIIELCDRTTMEDTILFYFAGHGMLVNGNAYLALPSYEKGNIENTALSIININTLFKEKKRKNFIILDACHAGLNTRELISNSFIDIILSQSSATFSACSVDEVSYSDDKFESGVFTYYICKAIKQWKKNSEITIEELKIEVSKEVYKWCNSKNYNQNPTLSAYLVGNVSFAKRNNKVSDDDIVIIDNKDESSFASGGKIIVDNNSLDIYKVESQFLWSSAGGVNLPKVALVSQILSLNKQLKNKDIIFINDTYTRQEFQYSCDVIWPRSIEILRQRVLSLGLKFVGEMVGIDNSEYVNNLPDFEVVNLAYELGFIDKTGKLRLSHANELVKHYQCKDIDEEMPQNECDTVMRACIQYIIGYDNAEVGIEYNDFRENLKLIKFQTNELDMLINSPYFYKKTTIRTLVNLIGETEGVEFETVFLNFGTILENLWDSLSSEDKYFVGTTYSKYANSGDVKYIVPYKQALKKVRGFDYVPENLRSLSFVKAAKNIKKTHNELDNFYNEPSAVRDLEKLGTKIPKPAVKEVVSSILTVMIGNAYGISRSAQSPAQAVLNKLDNSDWKYFLDECLLYDEDILLKISCKDERTERWCKVVNDNNLDKIEVKNGKTKEFVNDSSSYDYYKASQFAKEALKKL